MTPPTDGLDDKDEFEVPSNCKISETRYVLPGKKVFQVEGVGPQQIMELI